MVESLEATIICGFIATRACRFENVEHHWLRPPALRLIPPVLHYLGLDPKQIGLDGGRAPQPPQQRCQPQHQLALDRGPDIVIRGDRRFKRSVVVDIFNAFDDGLRAKPVPDGVSPRPVFALFRARTGAFDGVASVGFDLSE
jgi:hypothetical protein